MIMKTKLVLASALLALTCAVKAETMSFTSTFKAEDVTLVPVGNGETLIDLADGRLGSGEFGRPAIPTKSFAVRLPADTAVAGCKVTLGETVLIAEDVTPVCEQRPVPGIADDPEPTPRDAVAYASADPYPAARAVYVATSSMRGIKIASFRLAPVWYVAAEKKLYLAKSVTVEIEIQPVPQPLAANVAVLPASGLFEEAANSLVINPSVPRYAKSVSRGGSGCQYLVITSNSFVSVAQKLADFRADFNHVTAAVVDTATIDSNYSGTDLPEKIRACIKWYVQYKGTEYVVLAGDDTVVPARMAKLDSSLYPSATAMELVTPSDIYYSDLDATWTKDSSDVTWGSWNCTSTYSGLAPDVIVGRLPVRTRTQLDGYITKLVAYEQDTGDDSDIVRKTLFGGYTCWEELYRKSGGWEQHYVYSASSPSVTQSSVTSLPETFNDGLREVGDRTTVGLLAADVEVWARRLNRDFHRTYYPCLRTSFFFNSATSWDKSTSTNSLQTVTRFMEVLNQGYHQLFFDTHGGFNSWGLGGTFTYDGSSTRGYKDSYRSIDAERLAGRVDFIYTSACNTGAFDLEEPSLSEGFLRASGGAIGYIGCSRYGWDIQMGKVSGWGPSGGVSGPSKDFARAFWKRLFVSKDRTLGAAFANHKNAMISDTSYQDYNKWLQLGINLQGDPLATYHLPSSDETRTSAKPGLVTLLRDNPIVTTADGATIGLAADEIPCGKTAKVELEYSKNSNFSSSTSVTVAPSLANQDELRHSLSGLSAGTTYYVRGKIMVDGQTNLSPFSLSFTTKAAGTATVAGRVENLTGRALAGITVSAVAEGGATVATATTDANGSYQLAVPSGWTGTIVLSDSAGRISDGLSKPVSLASNALVTLDFKASGAPFYVKQGATGSGDGSSWANAFTTLDAAFATVEPGSIVWVAEGVYTPDTTLYGRDSHFAPPAYVAVYGGFAGNETSLEERDWIAHPTVLSADIGTKGTKTDNCYHVVRYNKGVLIDGFGLTGAYLDSTVRSAGYEDNYGAVVGTPLSNPAPVPSSTYPAEAPDEVLTLDHCAITNNVVPKRNGSGYGDLTSSSAKAVVRIRNTFVADNDVAGPHLFTNVSVENCTLTRNKSYSSGLCNCLVRNCLYLGNQKEVTGQGEPGTTSGTSWRGEDFFIYFYDNKVSAGSGNFMADSYYIRSDQNLGITGDILASGNNPAGWITDADTGFAYALNEESGAAEKGKVLEWMTEDTLDYLGHPRVHGTVPDLGCCEAVADAGGEEEDDDDDDDEIIRPEDAPVKPENEINAMTWETLFPTAKTYADSATSFTLPYRQHSPTTATGVKYPLVIFLHGAGEIGSDNAKQVQTENDVIPITKYAMKHGDAFVLAPQCPGASGSDYSLTWSGANWNNYPMTRLETPTKPMAALVKLITEFVAENPVDPTRIYVTGLSMGGFGTWDLASRMSDTFAAVMPCCGGADPNAASLYDDGMAIRFFHGSSDNVVSPDFSRGMDTALTTAGIEHDYIEYSGVNHVDCWRKAYVDTDLNLEWLFGHIKGEEYVAPDHGDTTENAPLSTVANGGWLGWKLDKNESFIVNRGTKVWAYAQNYSCRQGRFGANLVVNEVEFTKSGGFASDDTGIKNHITCDKTFGYGRDNFGVEDLSDGTSDFARMITTGWEATGDQGPAQTYTLHGLTSGKMYLVQFIYHCASTDRAMLSVIAPGGTVSTRVNGWDANGQNLDENWRYGGSLVGVFTASGSDQTLVITYSKTANYILNAVQLREVTVADLTDGPAIEYGTPTIGSVTPSVNGTTATLTLANVASGENGGCYQVWLAYAEDGVTLGNETAALISQQSASCAVEIKNLTAGKKYNYSLYVKNEGNVISAKKTGSFTMPGGSDPDPVEPPSGDESGDWIAIPMTSNGSVFSTDGDLVFAFSRDRGDPGTTYENSSTPVTFNYLNSLTDTVTKYHQWQHGGEAIDGPYGNGLQPADYIAVSPVLNGAKGECGNEGLGSDMSGFGSMLGCMWTGSSSDLKDMDNKATFTFKRLTSGHKYLVEFFIHDHDQAKSITSPDGKATIYYGGTGWQYGGVLRGKFTAVAATQDIVLTYSDPDSYGMGAIQLRDLGVAPEDPDDPQDETIASAAAKLGVGRWLAMPLTGDPADFITEGTLAVIGNNKMSGSRKYQSDSTVQNIPFGGSNKANDHMVGNPTFSGNKDCGSGADCGLGLECAYGNILKYGWSGASAVEYQTISFSGFDPEKTYLVQYIIHGELNVTNRYDEVTDDMGTHRIWQSAATAGEKWYYGGTLIHVFKPDSEGNYTLQIAHRSVGNNGTVSNQNGLMNAYQIREVTREEQPEEPPEEPEEIPVYTLTIPAKSGLVIGSVTTNGTAVAGTEGVYSIVSNTEVTITFAAASGYELDDNDGVVKKTIESNYTFVDADYPAVKEQGGDEPIDPPSGADVWTAQPVSSDAREFSTDGDLVWAMTCSSGDPGRTHYLNGIPFGDCGYTSGTDYLLSDYAVFSPAMNGAVDKFGYEGLNTDAMTFGGTLARGWFNANGTGKFAMTLKGLTAGRKYCVQIFTHNSGENKNDHNDGMTSDTITAPDGEKTITYGGEGWKYGGILTGTFVATNTQHSFAFTHSRSSYFQVNAIQLREIETVTPPPPHEHVWSDWVTNTTPTATTPGERTRTCIAAGCTVPPVTETEVVPATGGGDEPGEDDPDEPGSIAEAVSKLAPGDWLAAPLTGRAADVVTKGNFVSACAPFEIVGDESVNNVSFSADKGDPNKQFVGALTVDIGNKPGAGTYKTSGFDSASGYGKILGNAWYAGNGMTKKFTYSNLTVGKTYLVQLFVHDGRTAQIGRTATAPGDSTKSVKYGDVNDTDMWYYGGTLIHVFTTTNTTYEFNVDYPSNAPQINAIQLRVIEATASWTSKPMTLAGNGNGAAFSAEGTQVFAFMPDDADAGTTATNLFACNVPIYLLNSLTDKVTKLHDATQKEWVWTQDSEHPWNGVFNDGRQPSDFMMVVPSLSRDTSCETVNGASEEFNCVLKRAFINYNGEKTMTVVFKNLTVGSEYIAELYVHHGFNGGTKYVTAPDGVTKAYFGGEGDWLYGGILSGRFVAKATQESFKFTYSASNALQFNAIQLRVLGGVTPPDPPERKCGFILVIH